MTEAREAYLENSLTHALNRVNELEKHIVNIAATAVDPPVMLDTDALAAHRAGEIAAQSQYKYVGFGFYRKKK